MIRTRPRSAALPAALIAAAVLVGTAALLATHAAAQMPVPPRGGPGTLLPDQTIVVSGLGTVEATPDRAIIAVGFQITRPTANDAQERASRTMTQILDRVMALGIPRDRIRTVEINLYPQRRDSGEISGYQAIQRMTVTIDDLALVGRVLDAAVTAGANVLDGVTFTLRDPAASRTRALASAIQDARSAANALATAAGLTSPRLVRIEEAGGPTPPFSMPSAVPGRAATQAPTTPVLPGTLTINAQIRAIFAF